MPIIIELLFDLPQLTGDVMPQKENEVQRFGADKILRTGTDIIKNCI